MSEDVISHRILNKKSKYRRNSKTSWLGEKKIVFLVMLILLYIGLIVCLEVGLSEVPFFAYLVGLSLLMIKLQKESLRQRLGLGRVRPRIYSIMFFILILSSVISGFICYFQVDIQLRYAILGSVIFAPIGEEMFFRGYMQGNFGKFFKSNKDKQKNKRATSIAVILTALLGFAQ
jgi:membrane protease YdiL (CAAX protease family)